MLSKFLPLRTKKKKKKRKRKKERKKEEEEKKREMCVLFRNLNILDIDI